MLFFGGTFSVRLTVMIRPPPDSWCPPKKVLELNFSHGNLRVHPHRTNYQGLIGIGKYSNPMDPPKNQTPKTPTPKKPTKNHMSTAAFFLKPVGKNPSSSKAQGGVVIYLRHLACWETLGWELTAGAGAACDPDRW